MHTRRISKFLSLVLRHKPETIGLSLDHQGWADTRELITRMNERGMAVTLEDIQQVVRDNDKQRFRLSDDLRRIRANQGHSIPIDLGLQPQSPPDPLYHGTAERNAASIEARGLLKGSRQHVHLSADVNTARKVGQRHGRPIIYQIDTRQMTADGLTFYRSDNGVWLTEYVAPEYLQRQA
jgi:putative RNA 2'-phosphotransferase